MAVAQLLRVVEENKASEVTVVIVEQSLNVALSIADRAVFMEKGRIRFAGTSTEFADRPDLLRVAFLGG
jgi:ABC-type branched-subunit amino acid transport system ATPase component